MIERNGRIDMSKFKKKSLMSIAGFFKKNKDLIHSIKDKKSLNVLRAADSKLFVPEITFSCPSNVVCAARISKDKIAVGLREGPIHIIEVKFNTLLFILNASSDYEATDRIQPIKLLSFCKQKLVSVYQDGAIYIWDKNLGTIIKLLTQCFTKEVLEIAKMGTNSLLVSLKGESMILLDIETDKILIKYNSSESVRIFLPVDDVNFLTVSKTRVNFFTVRSDHSYSSEDFYEISSAENLYNGNVAFGLSNGLIKITNSSNIKLTSELRGHMNNVSFLSFIKKKSLLISGGDDNLVISWDTNTNQCVSLFNLNDKESSYLFVRLTSSKLIAFLPNGNPAVLDLKNKKKEDLYDTIHEINCVFQINYHEILIGTAKGLLKGNLLTGSYVYVKKNVCVQSMERLGHTNSYVLELIFPNNEGKLFFYDLDSNNFSKPTSIQNRVSAMKQLSSKLLAIGFVDKIFLVINTETGEVKSATCSVGYISTILPISENEVATGTTRKTIFIWDLDSMKIRKPFFAHPDQVITLKLIKKDVMISAGNDGSVALWELPTCKKLKDFKLSFAISHMFRISEDFVAVVDGQNVKLISLTSEITYKTHSLPFAKVVSIIKLNEMQLLIVGSDTTMTIWNYKLN